jgi:ribonuclease P protein component
MQKSSRLKASADFQRVRKEGLCWSQHLLVLCALRNSDDRSRFGLSVSRRIGGAVVRNRVKRLLREAIRPNLPLVSAGWDVVFIARSPISDARFQNVQQAVATLLRRACLLKAPGTSLRSNAPMNDDPTGARQERPC